jgi:hypothetical protein
MTRLQQFRLDLSRLCQIESEHGVCAGHRVTDCSSPSAAYYSVYELQIDPPTDPAHLMRVCASIGPRGGMKRP